MASVCFGATSQGYCQLQHVVYISMLGLNFKCHIMKGHTCYPMHMHNTIYNIILSFVCEQSHLFLSYVRIPGETRICQTDTNAFACDRL